jgi:DNA gyrase subunit A
MCRMARGVKGVTLKDESDLIVGCEVVNGDETVLVVCENGFGKRSYVENFRQTNRGGVGVRSIITSDRNGNVVGAICVTDADGMVMISASGQTVRISMRDLRVMGRNTQGVKLVNLREGDNLVAIQKIEDTGENNSTIPEFEPPLVSEEMINEGAVTDEICASEEGMEELNMAEDENR